MKFFGQQAHLPFVLLAIVEAVLAGLAFLAAYVLLGDPSVELVLPLAWAVGFGAAVWIGLLSMGLYQPKQRLRTEGVMARLTIGLGVATIALALVDFFFPVGMSGGVWAVGLVFSIALLALVRIVFARLVDHEAFRRRVLVLGAGERASSLLRLRRRSDQRGFRLVAFIPASGDKCVIDDARVRRPEGTLLEFVRETNANEVVVAMDERRRSFPIRELLDCRFAGIDVIDVLAFLERETGRVKVDLVTPGWLIFSGGFRASPIRNVVARVFALLLVAATLAVTMPLMIVVAVAIAVEDGFPVLYRQRRVGLNGKEFTLYKFRSMVKDAESDGQARWADADDARVTKVGRVLRKLRLDELPQLINVVRGDMSLVGPRPERPEFVESLSKRVPYYGERHCVKPGITGWAQMSYPYGSSDEDAMGKLEFDLYYVKHQSVIFDLVVLLQTAEVVLWGKGAR